MVINSYQSHKHTFRIQTFYISCLLCVEFCQILLTLVERFIMLPRSRSRTCHIYVLLLHWKYAKTCFSSTSKCFTPTLGVNTKMCLICLSTKQMLQVLVNISLEKFCCGKETWGYAKEKVKKIKKKS